MVLTALPLRMRRITFGAFFRRLLERSRIVTLPVPERVVDFDVPAIRAVPVSFAALLPGTAVIVQTIDLPSALRSQVTRTFGVSPLSPLSPFAPAAPVAPVAPVAPAAPAAPVAPFAPAGPAGP